MNKFAGQPETQAMRLGITGFPASSGNHTHKHSQVWCLMQRTLNLPASWSTKLNAQHPKSQLNRALRTKTIHCTQTPKKYLNPISACASRTPWTSTSLGTALPAVFVVWALLREMPSRPKRTLHVRLNQGSSVERCGRVHMREVEPDVEKMPPSADCLGW